MNQKLTIKGSFPAKIIVNSITALRLVGALAIIPIYFLYGGPSAAFILIFLAATDWIDGFLARIFHASTFFGAFLDGLSDKSLSIITLFLLIPTYPVLFIIIIFLEFAIINILSYKAMMQGKNVKSNIIGKLKAWPLSMTIVLAMCLSNTDLAISFASSLNNAGAFSQLISTIITFFIDASTFLEQYHLLQILTYITIIFQAITFISYALDNHIPFQKKEKKIIKEEHLSALFKKTPKSLLTYALFDVDFYQKHKEEPFNQILINLNKCQK